MAKALGTLRWSRRDWLSTLGAGVGWGTMARFGAGDVVADAPQPPSQALATPRGAIIRTIAADLDPGAITGATLLHEHLGNGRRPAPRGQTAAPAGPPDNPTQDVDWMTVELKGARQAGVGCIVSASTGGAGTEIPAYLKTLSERTGMHLLNAGAYYTRQQYPADFATRTEDDIADGLVQMAAAGRLGAYGEFGVANGEADVDPLEKKVFRSVGRAHLRTGLPIFTHNNYATGPDVPADMALRQLDLFEAVGVNPASRLATPCCLDDPKPRSPRVSRSGRRRVRPGRRQQGQRRAPIHSPGVSRGLTNRSPAALVRLHRAVTRRGRDQKFCPLQRAMAAPAARPLILFVPQCRRPASKTRHSPRRTTAAVPHVRAQELRNGKRRT